MSLVETEDLEGTLEVGDEQDNVQGGAPPPQRTHPAAVVDHAPTWARENPEEPEARYLFLFDHG